MGEKQNQPVPDAGERKNLTTHWYDLDKSPERREQIEKEKETYDQEWERQEAKEDYGK